MSHNRITSLGGLNQLTNSHVLAELDLRDNRIADLQELNGLDDIVLSTLRTLQLRDASSSSKSSVSVRQVRPEGNVVCKRKGYVAAVRRLAPNITSLDGTTMEMAEQREEEEKVEEVEQVEQEELQQQEEVVQQEEMETTTSGRRRMRRRRRGVPDDEEKYNDDQEEDPGNDGASRQEVLRLMPSNGNSSNSNNNSSNPYGSRRTEVATPAIDRAKKMRALQLKKEREAKGKDKRRRPTSTQASAAQHLPRGKGGKGRKGGKGGKGGKVEKRGGQEVLPLASSSMSVLEQSKLKREKVRDEVKTYHEKIYRLSSALDKAKQKNRSLQQQLPTEDERHKLASKIESLARTTEESVTKSVHAEEQLLELRATLQEKSVEILTNVKKLKKLKELLERNVMLESKLKEKSESDEAERLAHVESAVRTALKESESQRTIMAQEEYTAMTSSLKMELMREKETRERVENENQRISTELVRKETERLDLEKTMEEMEVMTEARVQDVQSDGTRRTQELKTSLRSLEQQMLLKEQQVMRLREENEKNLKKLSSFEEKKKHVLLLESDLQTLRTTSKSNLEMEQRRNASEMSDLHSEYEEKRRVYEKEMEEKLEGAMKTSKLFIEEKKKLKKRVEELVTSTNDGQSNFDTLKHAFEEVSQERSQLRTALASATDVVRRQKEVLRRQASENVTNKRTLETRKKNYERETMEKVKEKEMIERKWKEAMAGVTEGARVAREELEITMQSLTEEHRRALERVQREQEQSKIHTKKTMMELREKMEMERKNNIILKKREEDNVSGMKEKEMWEKERERWEKEHKEGSVALKVKERQLEDTTDTILELKKKVKQEEERRRDAEDRVERYSEYKHDLRRMEEERDDLQQEFEEFEMKAKERKTSFAAIREHLEAIIEEQVSLVLFCG